MKNQNGRNTACFGAVDAIGGLCAMAKSVLFVDLKTTPQKLDTANKHVSSLFARPSQVGLFRA